ncbi:MAG: superoxide dismutase [Ni] [Planctomycetota bacterium]
MNRLAAAALFVVLALAAESRVDAHCQVPCGIYDDPARIKLLFEHESTIAKAIDQIGELADTHEPTGHNQLSRWVLTKEQHATDIQRIMADYFMTQRIKPDAEGYTDLLTKAHAVMIAAMKCKQAADPATAKALHESIRAFEEAYGK